MGAAINELSARCPALLVAAPASGQGKTTVAAALARLHTRAGRRVRAFKVGPDFLDPYWLEAATGAPVHALDLWMVGEQGCAAMLHAAAQENDLIVIEGAMGLFDGQPSAADLAERFGVPVVAVVDAGKMAGTFGALAYGLRHYRPGLPWAGVLANQVASLRHGDMLKAGLRDADDWLGSLPRSADWALRERHLGLSADLPASEALARIDAAADALAATPLAALPLERWAVDFPAPASTSELPALLAGRRVAIARDASFAFVYQANLDTLRGMGAELSFFSPLAGEALPDCDAVWLPGGYPELYPRQLAEATASREGLAAHIAAGKPVWAECGGMMALMDEICDMEGRSHPGWGLLPGVTRMQRRLAALGPQQLALPAGTLRGHTFHYSTAASPLPVVARTARPDGGSAGQGGEAVYAHEGVMASYFHAWFASCPEAVAALLGGRA
ncbi:cobyrinate a,c-diamide synthase [Xylophilus rhododendri]|uniref:Cobyrinate a,c-diamide synthase n=1 Tax=Xylophilus rhododendri TaxID=2697032 RepID=A0A857J1L5_9BURK|nr:cobyrinate a,c-diamide synthase [Xylophilus rhododendri]QHI97049.1 cobyrinate a,c-diamide synthase [Xylophilus rhododendri]